MRFFAILFAVLFVVSFPPDSRAQEVVPELEEEKPDLPESEPLHILPGEEAQNSLDALFTKLRQQTNATKAKSTARAIRMRLVESDSDTVNLLMNWSAQAMKDKNNALAEDLLNQVTLLAPDYAEGWNRRATLYYQMSEYGKSISDIERTLQLEPRHFGALSGLAIILKRSGSDRKAMEAWYQVLEIYPANDAAQKAVIDLEEELAGRGS